MLPLRRGKKPNFKPPPLGEEPNLSLISPPLAGGASGGRNRYLLRVNRYNPPIAAWLMTQIKRDTPNASGPREASG
jgi:hypothetical protein